jgi:Uri superfamily endonuclease
MKGTYILVIKVDQLIHSKVGKLGILSFNPGFYAYVGSALNNMEKRIQRHLTPAKKKFWHIDYLIEKAEIVTVFQIESSDKFECYIAEKLSEHLTAIPHFGCSDCKCFSHLFFHREINMVINSIKDVFQMVKSGWNPSGSYIFSSSCGE